jgi:hypothetical protein
MKKGAGIITDPEMKRIRALMMVQFKIKTGATIPEVAKEFGVSENTVKRNLSFVKRAKLLADLEDRILNELGTAAFDAIKNALTDTDAPSIEKGKLGLETFKGFIPGFQKKQGPAPVQAGDDLASYIATLRAAEGENDNVIDGETVEGSAQRALPAAEAQPPAEGDAPAAGPDADGLGPLTDESTSLGGAVSEGSLETPSGD